MSSKCYIVFRNGWNTLKAIEVFKDKELAEKEAKALENSDKVGYYYFTVEEVSFNDKDYYKQLGKR